MLLGGWCARLVAGELAYGVGYSLTYETNPASATANPVSDYHQEAIAGIAYRESTASVNARLLAQAEARDYRRDTFADDTYFYFDGLAVWSIVPKTFDWTIDDRREETRVDLTVVDDPANRATTNTFSTGPDWTLRFGRVTALVLGARYGQVDVEDEGGNRRATGYARLEYLLSAASKLRLNYESSHIRVEPPSLVTEARREDLYARYESRTSPANELGLEVGATRIALEDQEQPTHPRFRLSLARQLAPTSAIRAALFDYLSDTYTDSLSRDTTVISPPSTNDVYRTRGAGVGYSAASGRAVLNLGAYTQRIEYENIGDDYDEDVANLGFTWHRAVDFRLNASAAYTKRLFPDLGRTDVETNLGASMSYQFTRTVSLIASAEYERTEITPVAETIVNRTISLLLAYSSDLFYVPQSKR